MNNTCVENKNFLLRIILFRITILVFYTLKLQN